MHVGSRAFVASLLMFSMSAGWAQLVSGGPQLIAHDTLTARPKKADPAASSNGRPGKMDDTPFAATSSISWRSTRPVVEFKWGGAGPFPKTGTFEVFDATPKPAEAKVGLSLSPVNQLKVVGPAPLYSVQVTTDADGKFAVDFGAFAPKEGGRRARPIGLVGGGETQESAAVKEKRAKIGSLGYTDYIARVVGPSGASSSNAVIEYGEALPPDAPANLEAKNPSQNGPPWLKQANNTRPVFAMRWWTLVPDAASAVFQVSSKGFPEDPRMWRVPGLMKSSGPIPFGSPTGINEFGLDLANYLPGGSRAKGTYYLRVVALRSNGDLAAQPSDPVQVNLTGATAEPLPETTFEIWENIGLANAGEFKEKPHWATSAYLDSTSKFSMRWATAAGIDHAKVAVRRIDDWSNDLVFEGSVDHQGQFELEIGPTLVKPNVYEITLTPVDANGKQAAQDAKIINSTPDQKAGGLPPSKYPPGFKFNCDVTVDHYEPPKGVVLYHFVLAKEPKQGTPIDDAMYSFCQAVTHHAQPHRGDKVYMPPKPDGGKSWTDYLADGVNYVIGLIKWAESAAVSLNNYYDELKQKAAEGISSATGGLIPVDVARLGIDIGCEAMGISANPFDFPGMTALGSDYLAGEVLDATGAGDALRDQTSQVIQSGIKSMAKSGEVVDSPDAPMFLPDPDYAEKPAVMVLRATCTSDDPNAYGGNSPVSIRVESWYSDQGAPQDHVVLFENTVVLPKMRAGQTILVPVALKPTAMSQNEPGRWNKAFNMTSETWFTVDGTKIKDRLCTKAWP